MKITKLKPWAIYYTNNHGIKFLIHISTDGYENGIYLYNRNVDSYGNYNLEHIASRQYGDRYIKSPWLNKKHGQTYDQMGKAINYFIQDVFGSDALLEVENMEGQYENVRN